MRKQSIELVELVELGLCGIAVSKFRCPFHLPDDGVERAAGMLRRAEIAQASVRFGSETIKQRRSKPRLSNASFTGQEHHLVDGI